MRVEVAETPYGEVSSSLMIIGEAIRTVASGGVSRFLVLCFRVNECGVLHRMCVVRKTRAHGRIDRFLVF